jgi:hypothetical protein
MHETKYRGNDIILRKKNAILFLKKTLFLITINVLLCGLRILTLLSVIFVELIFL